MNNLFRRDFLKLAGQSMAVSPAILSAGAQAPAPTSAPTAAVYSVRTYGATGDGKTLDTAAINRAIEAASAAGGGTVHFPAGVYLSYSIHLKSNIALLLDGGATILAASTPDEGTTNGYDAAEPNPNPKFQDFGHNSFHNSLIWGKGLASSSRFGTLMEFHPGVGNKAIGLKNCVNVVLRDFSILMGGHFGILATGVDNFVLDNLKIDTQRDGMDIDCCKNVRITNCSVNSPKDDGICLKSSYALGTARATECVTIANCYVTGSYEVGSVIDGTWKKFPPEKEIQRTGRIKFGTESNGGFKNITITNCVFDGSCGIALETADGAQLEDVAISNITMRDCANTPLFLRICARMRGPENAAIGTLKRVSISNLVSYNSVSTFACFLSGIPGHSLEDIRLSDIYLEHQGGGTVETAKLVPPEDEKKYPDPTRFGPLPAHGFLLRHIRNLQCSNIEVAYSQPDARPMFWLLDVDGADFFRMKQPKAAKAPMFNLVSDVQDFRVFASRGVADTHLDKASGKVL